MHVHLSGITKKGKDRVRQSGSTWLVLSTVDPISQGRWLISAGRDWRWIHPKDDPNFEVTVIKPV